MEYGYAHSVPYAQKYILNEMKRLGISIAEMARLTNYSDTHVSRTLKKKNCSFEALKTIYRALLKEIDLYEQSQSK